MSHNTFKLNTKCGWIVPSGAVFEDGTVFPPFCEFGDSCKFGDSCNIPHGCTMEDVEMQQWTTISNLDGSGRQVIIILHKDGVKIRAGCFSGSLEEFVMKATLEGKKIYASVVPSIVNAISLN